MFREMRRIKQQMSEGEAIEVLKACSTGILAVAGDDDYPYAVPLNYVYRDGSIFFHCAVTGHKMDAIRRNDKVSFCVTGQDQIVPEAFATKYRSVVVFGRARIIEDDTEVRSALEELIGKYSPAYKKEGEKEIDKDWNIVRVVEVRVEHITGKTASKAIMDM
ncbi:MAG: pyridoxamine 5'-phosphate oxidase family protein [Clostridiales bacterium]|nr:pyridoxamine 5'-phosphate oxidase family protein [Clostridiales bacterium]